MGARQIRQGCGRNVCVRSVEYVTCFVHLLRLLNIEIRVIMREVADGAVEVVPSRDGSSAFKTVADACIGTVWAAMCARKLSVKSPE